ncbi:MAG: glutamine-hydrolyzing GMP synthase, partial [Candidatus Latescibacterota bacterium]
MVEHGIVILDYGSQYTQLIARRIRGMRVYSQIFTPTTPETEVFESNPRGLVLSGGPSSVFGADAPVLPDWFDRCEIPVLGICYGMQLIAQRAGAVVEPSPVGEYGHTTIQIRSAEGLFDGIPDELNVWMSHGDKIHDIPKGMSITAASDDCPVAAFSFPSQKHYGVQFHPEVRHTSRGDKILE